MPGILDHLDLTSALVTVHTGKAEFLEDRKPVRDRTFIHRCTRVDGQTHLGDIEITGAQGYPGRLAAMATPHGLERTVQRNELPAFGGGGIEQPLVDAGITARVKQMDASRGTITSSTTAHLVEFGRTKGHVVQHHVADIGQVHALTERRCGDDAGEYTVTKRRFDDGAIGPAEAGVVKSRYAARSPPFAPAI